MIFQRWLSRCCYRRDLYLYSNIAGKDAAAVVDAVYMPWLIPVIICIAYALGFQADLYAPESA